jgi:hypothetical protein
MSCWGEKRRNRTHALQPKSANYRQQLRLADPKRSPESGSIRLVMTAPPIIDGGWFQPLAITNRG